MEDAVPLSELIRPYKRPLLGSAAAAMLLGLAAGGLASSRAPQGMEPAEFFVLGATAFIGAFGLAFPVIALFACALTAARDYIRGRGRKI